MTEYPAKTKEEYLEFYRAKRSLFHRYIGFTFIILVFSWVYALTGYLLFFEIITDTPFYYIFDPILMLNIILIIDLLWFLLLIKNIRDSLVPWILVLILSIYLYYLLMGGGRETLSAWILCMPLVTIFFYWNGLGKETKDAKYIASHYSYNASQEHTAVILPHDSKKMFDGSDGAAAYLLKELADREAYQVYFCPTEMDILHVLQNPNIQGVWVFGHGSKHGVDVKDKFSIYSELFTELTDSGPILRDVPKKEYVYQCHCNGGNGISLPYFLLETRGYLDKNIDDMPNYRDTGYGYAFGDDKFQDKLVNFSIGKWEPFTCLRNLNSDGNNNKFIDMYISHLKKRDVSS